MHTIIGDNELIILENVNLTFQTKLIETLIYFKYL